jgi:hypothetical protein
MLITISKLLALVVSFATVTNTLTFLSNDGQVCWTKVSQKEIIQPDSCPDEFHVYRNKWCEGICTSDYKDDGDGFYTRKCPDGWIDFGDTCAMPIGKPRRMSFPIWDTPEGTGCDAGYHVSEYIKITCIPDCPARMTEVALSTACKKDTYHRTTITDANCRPGYEQYFNSCKGCGDGLSTHGDVCVKACPAGYT